MDLAILFNHYRGLWDRIKEWCPMKLSILYLLHWVLRCMTLSICIYHSINGYTLNYISYNEVAFKKISIYLLILIHRSILYIFTLVHSYTNTHMWNVLWNYIITCKEHSIFILSLILRNFGSNTLYWFYNDQKWQYTGKRFGSSKCSEVSQ